VTAPVDPAPVLPEREPAGVRDDVGPGLFDITRWDPQEALRAAAHRELPADLLEEGARRLARIALVAAVVLGAYLGATLGLVPRTELPGNAAGLLVAAIVMSLLVFGLSGLRRLRPQTRNDAGFLYLVLLCLLLGLLRHSQAWPATESLREVSPVAIPILVFGALIPAPPRKILLVSLGAAAMDPLSLYVMRTTIGVPPVNQTLFLLGSPFLAALVAYAVSRVVHRLSEGYVHAREIGSYHLTERLGVGGMAEVWRADHQLLARPAALKLIRPQVLAEHGPRDGERLLRLFAREARTTASLNSPHTIQIYDFGITREGAFYYVMELLEGVDLQTLVQRFGPQSAERVAYLLCQACHSLGEAHERNFVHRDVKPANIFACHYAGDHDFVKVLDFGLVLDRVPTRDEIDDEQRFVGTPAVMAPEMVRFQAPVDARTDLYALGCVGYWLLTGQRVFEAATRNDMLVMHAHQTPDPPSKRLGEHLHDGLEAVVMTCLEKNPNRRPQTARELGESLRGLHFEYPWTEERARLWWEAHAGTQPHAGTEPHAGTQPKPATS
jgi:serine/threonine-protein kinase